MNEGVGTLPDAYIPAVSDSMPINPAFKQNHIKQPEPDEFDDLPEDDPMGDDPAAQPSVRSLHKFDQFLFDK